MSQAADGWGPVPLLTVVDSPAAARQLTAPGGGRGPEQVVSTHLAVEQYLRARGVPALDLTRYLDDETFRANHAASERLINAIVRELDDRYSRAFSSALGLDVSIAWFSALYSTCGQYDLFGILNGLTALRACLERHAPAIVRVHGQASFSIVDGAGDLPELVEAALRLTGDRAVLERVAVAVPGRPGLSARSMARRLFHSVQRLSDETANALQVISGHPASILFESLYDLTFLKRSGAIGPVVCWRTEADPWALRWDRRSEAPLQAFGQSVQNASLSSSAGESDLEVAAVSLMTQRIMGDLSRRWAEYGLSLLRMQRLVRRGLVTRGVWGNDPIIGAKAVLVDYLLKSGVEVVGCQHGAVYGTQKCAEQVHSAYKRCTRFLSYGMTASDAGATATEGAGNTEIVPVGSLRIARAVGGAAGRQERPAVGVFYPITNNVSVLCSSQRMKTDAFVERQAALLRVLDAIGPGAVTVKMPPVSADAPTALETVLAECGQIVVSTERVMPFMQRHDVRAVLIDANYSTCLIEVLPFDCDVIVLHDSMIPFSSHALSLLMGRVHYCYSVAECQVALAASVAGQLERRRDGGFLERYVVPANTDVRRSIEDAITRTARTRMSVSPKVAGSNGAYPR